LVVVEVAWTTFISFLWSKTHISSRNFDYIILQQFQRSNYFRFWRLCCCFQLSFVMSVSRTHFTSSPWSKTENPKFAVVIWIMKIIAREKKYLRFWLPHYHYYLQYWSANVFFELAVVENLRFAVGISMLSVISRDRYMYFRFRRLYYPFQSTVVVAIARRYFLRSGHVWKPPIFPRNFEVCHNW